MKKIFEEPTMECVQIFSEVVTEGLPEIDGGAISNDYWQ